MLGTIVNCVAVIIGTLLGVLLNKRMPKRLETVLTPLLGICTLVIGLQGALETQNILILLLSIVLGGVVGTLLMVEHRLTQLGDALQTKFAQGKGNISEGFVTSTLIFCVGSMAVIGSINSGLHHDHSILFAKSILDGVMSMILASTLGIGVILSAVSLFIYQGTIVLLSQFIAPFVTEAFLLELGAVGGVLIMCIGFNLFREKKIPVADALPALLVTPFIYFIFTL